MISRLVLVLLHAGSQVGGPTSVAPAQDEDSGKRLIRSASKKEAEGETKKKLKKMKGKNRKEVVKKEKSFDKITKKKGKSQRPSNQGKNKNRRMKDVEKRRKEERKIKQSTVFTGENCDFIDFASVRTLGAECADGSKMVLKNK